MSKVRVEVPETPQAPRRRSRVGASCAVALVLLATHVALAPAAPAETNPEPKRDPNTVSVTADQMHQISIVDVASCAFSVQKLAIGQIAFNEDASTVVLTPFSGSRHQADRQTGRRGEARRSAVRDRQPGGSAGAHRLHRSGAGRRKKQSAACARPACPRPANRALCGSRDVAARGRAGAQRLYGSRVRREDDGERRRGSAQSPARPHGAQRCRPGESGTRSRDRFTRHHQVADRWNRHLAQDRSWPICAQRLRRGAVCHLRSLHHVAQGGRARERHSAHSRRAGDRGEGHCDTGPRVQGQNHRP